MRLKRWILLILATAGLVWLLERIGFDRIGLSFQRLGFRGAATIVAFGLVEALLDGWALREAALGRVSYVKTLLINQTGAFLNIFAPVEAGEVLKATLLARHSRDGASTAVLVWNMASRLAKSSIIFAAAAAAFFFLSPMRSRAAVCLGFAALNILVYAIMAAIIRFGGVGRTLLVISRLPFLKGERVRRMVAHIQDAERQTSRFCHEYPLRYAAVLAAHAGARLAGLTTTWAALSFLAPGSPLLLSVLVYAAMELMGYVVAVLPTRVGTMEGSAFLVFAFLGLDGGLGAVLQLVLRVKQLIVTGSLLTIGTLGSEKFAQSHGGEPSSPQKLADTRESP